MTVRNAEAKELSKGNEQREEDSRARLTHDTAMRRLTWAIVGLMVVGVVLTLVTLWANYNKPGRYVISTSTTGTVVLDTKTSRLWIRSGYTNVYLGTNENPTNVMVED